MKTTIIAGTLLALGLTLPGMAVAASCSPARGQTGQFDYYVLSLSWSPAFCASPAGAKHPDQCGAEVPKHGFVVHGLWPQYAAGSAAQQQNRSLWPQCCGGASFDPAAVPATLDGVMIGDDLRRHEWDKHGTCATTAPAPYFQSVAETVAKIGLAPKLSGEAPPARIKISELKTNFPVPANALYPTCKGKKLSEIHICLDKSLNPTACPPETRQQDKCPGTVSLAP